MLLFYFFTNVVLEHDVGRRGTLRRVGVFRFPGLSRFLRFGAVLEDVLGFLGFSLVPAGWPLGWSDAHNFRGHVSIFELESELFSHGRRTAK